MNCKKDWFCVFAEMLHHLGGRNVVLRCACSDRKAYLVKTQTTTVLLSAIRGKTLVFPHCKSNSCLPPTILRIYLRTKITAETREDNLEIILSTVRG